MSFLKKIWHKDLIDLYDKDTKKLLKEFENYLYFILEKYTIICDIKNKAINIEFKDKHAYVKEDLKAIIKKEYYKGGAVTENLRETYYYYYKSFVNKKLKRLKKILTLGKNIFSKLSDNEKDIISIITNLKIKYKDLYYEHEFESLKDISEIFKSLELILDRQILYVKSIYPLKDWTLDIHKKLFSQENLVFFKKELELLMTESLNDNYNRYPGIIAKHLNVQDLPIESNLKKIIEHNNEIVKKKRDPKSDKTIDCYHAVTKYNYATRPYIFPLSVETKGTGFFIDLDPNETAIHVAKIYGVLIRDLILFKITISQKTFKKAKQDIHDDSNSKTELDNSYFFRPTEYPYLNTEFFKGNIKITQIATQQ